MEYVILGRTGLAVSRLCLGTMTFGDKVMGLVSEQLDSQAVFHAFLDAGGNFVDTADGYGQGDSERQIGRIMADGKLRDRIVLATKYTFSPGGTDPNTGGNGRKNAMASLEGSLRRLQTDYLDLYWMHGWDSITPVEEVVYTFDAMIRAGKIRYYGLSNVPAWYVARAVSLAERHGLAPPIALQMQYSLAERSIEWEHLPASRELGLGLCPYSPLSGGALTGKYRPDGKAEEDGRLARGAFGGMARMAGEGFWETLDVLEDVAREVERTPAQVALNWVAYAFPSTSVIIGVSKPAQLTDNLAALDFTLTSEQRTRLNQVSAREPHTPYLFWHGPMDAMLYGAFPRP